MSTLAFIAELVKALAWPVATIVIAVIFYKQISALLSRVRKGRIGPAEFEFEQGVQELAKQTPVQLQQVPVSSPTASLATTNPRAAILQAWVGVESAIQRLAYHRHLPAPSVPPTPLSIIRAVERDGALQADDIALFNELRVLRVRATDDVAFSPSAESAIKYVQLAQGLKARIEEAGGGR